MILLLCCFYALTTLFIALYLKSLRFERLRFLRWFLFVTVILHLAVFLTNSSDPRWITTSLLGVAAWSLSLRRSTLSIVLVLLPILVVVLLFDSFNRSDLSSGALPSPWIWVHVLLMIAGETLFVLSAAVSMVYLAASREMKISKKMAFFSRISNLPAMEALLQELIFVGFLFLSAGMGMGFFFAKQYWEVGWLLDPKVLACVATWLLYASLLILRQMRSGMKGKRSAQIAVVGFLCILFLAWGVDRFFPSQHLNYRMMEIQP